MSRLPNDGRATRANLDRLADGVFAIVIAPLPFFAFLGVGGLIRAACYLLPGVGDYEPPAAIASGAATVIITALAGTWLLCTVHVAASRPTTTLRIPIDGLRQLATLLRRHLDWLGLTVAGRRLAGLLMIGAAAAGLAWLTSTILAGAIEWPRPRPTLEP